MLIIYNIQTNIFINRVMNIFIHNLVFIHKYAFQGNVTPRTFVCLLSFAFCLFPIPCYLKKCIFAASSTLRI